MTICRMVSADLIAMLRSREGPAQCTVSASISIISNQLPGQMMIIFSHDTSHHHYHQTNNAVVKIQSCRGDEVMKLGHNVHD